MSITFGSVCSGIEAASVAWRPLGWRAAWLAEIEPFPCAVLAHHYPEVPNLGDMTKVATLVRDGLIPAPDVFCGGTPCQAFSMAGRRKSLDDARGNLSLLFCEIADEIDERREADGLLPSIIGWENVIGVLTTKDNAFGCFLGGLAGEDQPIEPGPRPIAGKSNRFWKWDWKGGNHTPSWPLAGCVVGPTRTVAWRVLDAKYFGVAQQRRRLLVLASGRGGVDPIEVLFEFDSESREIAAPASGEGDSPSAAAGFTLCRFLRTDNYRESDLTSTLTARDYKDARDLVVCPDGSVRGLTPGEYEVLQGFPRSYTAIPGAKDGERYKAIGNSWAVPKFAWLGRRIDAAIRNSLQEAA